MSFTSRRLPGKCQNLVHHEHILNYIENKKNYVLFLACQIIRRVNVLKKHFNFLEQYFVSVATAAIILASLGITARPAKSAALALSDDNSIAAFDPSFSDISSNNGILFWTVDNVNHLFQNSFWYRVGTEGRENSISTLNLINLEQPADNQISVGYAGNGFEIALDYTLDGGAEGSGKSNLLENITLQNTQNSDSNPLDFHFFNYTDFDLTENGMQDTTTIDSGKVTVSDNITLAKEVVSPVSNSYQVSPIFNVLNSLEDTEPSILANFSGPLTGDTAHAFGWDLTLAPGESFSITSNKSITPVAPTPVPEADTTLGLLGFSSLMLLWRLRPTQVIAE